MVKQNGKTRENAVKQKTKICCAKLNVPSLFEPPVTTFPKVLPQQLRNFEIACYRLF